MIYIYIRLQPYFGGLLCLLGWWGDATLSKGVRGPTLPPISGAYSAYWGAGGGGGGECATLRVEGGLLCPLISGVYFSYCCGGDATLSTVEGNYSARLFRWRTLSTGVRGATLLCLRGKGGPTLPHYFNGLLSLQGRGGYSVHGGEGGLLCLLGWGWLLCPGGEGGLLCPPISWAYYAYWGGRGGDATLSTGVRGAYSAALFRGPCSAYWGAGGDPTLSTGLRGTYSTPLFRGLLCILGCWVGGGDATLSTGVRGAYSAHLFRVSRPPSPP